MKALLGLILFLVSAAGANPKATNKETLTIGVASEFDNLHPIVASQAVTRYIQYMAYRPLVILNLDYKWVPLLIKEIPTVDNKLAKRVGNGLQATIEILPAAKWSDGTPVTCKDVVFAWQVGKNKNVSNPNREPYENITSIAVDKSNPKKCTLSFAKAKYDYFTSFPDPLPAHLEEEIFKVHSEKPEGYDVNSLYTKRPETLGLYNGPYMISEVKLGSHVALVPNPYFHGKKPYFKQVIVKLVPNNATFEANLRSGIVDMVSPSAGLGLDQAIVFEKKVKSENLPFTVHYEDGVVYAHIDLNQDHPILSDLKVRKALSLAFNKKDMIDSLLDGRGKPAATFVTDKDPWYTTNIPVYNYSRREAQRLLDEAGWKMGPKGIREKNGKTLSLTLSSAAGAKLNEMIMAYLQDKFKAVGVELNLKTEAARVFFSETVNRRKYDMALYSWISVPENTPRSTLHSGMIPSEKNAWAGQNSCGYRNPEVDKLIDQLEQELSAKKRVPLAQKIMEHYAKDIPVIPLYYRPNNAVTPKDMKGYRLSGHLFYETLYIENWSR